MLTAWCVHQLSRQGERCTCCRASKRCTAQMYQGTHQPEGLQVAQPAAAGLIAVPRSGQCALKADVAQRPAGWRSGQQAAGKRFSWNMAAMEGHTAYSSSVCHLSVGTTQHARRWAGGWLTACAARGTSAAGSIHRAVCRLRSTCAGGGSRLGCAGRAASTPPRSMP